MLILIDYKNRKIRYTDERIKHSENSHPEMVNQLEKIKEALLIPEYVIESKTDTNVELLYKHYALTPVKAKYLCITVKYKDSDNFIITAYFTDTIKKGNLLWEKK